MTSPRPDTRDDAEENSLDLVQRLIMSTLIGVVLGTFSAVLAVYLALRGAEDLERVAVLGLWVMTGAIGLVTAGTILVVNRRRPYSPWIVAGLAPMAVSALWVLG